MNASPREPHPLYRDSLVCDMLLPGREIPYLNSFPLERIHAAGLHYISLTLGGDLNAGLEAVLTNIATFRAQVLKAPDRFLLVNSADDILSARESSRLAVSFNFQGTRPFARNLSLVETYYRLGVRMALLAYNQRNETGDGCHEPGDGGLSKFGRSLIEEMNRVGMIVDCSHTGYRTSMDAMEASNAPVIFSHSVCRALVDHGRNIRDDQIKACAETGGIIGVNGIGIFLADDGRGTVDAVCRHVDHMAGLVGAEHIGIGLDFVDYQDVLIESFTKNKNTFPQAGYPLPPWKLVEPEDLPALTEALLANGYSDHDVRGILGENFLRIARQIWK